MEETGFEFEEEIPPYTFEGKNILLVDDNDIGRKMMNLILEKMGAFVETARSGEETLRMLDNEMDFDFILLDVHMPGMGGIACARQIEDTPVFMIAENVSENEKRELRLAGALDCFKKPLDYKNLVRTIGQELAN